MDHAMTSAGAAELIDASWKGWIVALEGVPETRWSEPGVCGDWSIKDVLGHIAVWDQVAIDYLGMLARGEDPGESIDWQAINDASSSLRVDRNIEQQRAEMDETHISLLGVLTADAAFNVEILGGSTWEHYDEHAAQVRDWR